MRHSHQSRISGSGPIVVCGEIPSSQKIERLALKRRLRLKLEQERHQIARVRGLDVHLDCGHAGEIVFRFCAEALDDPRGAVARRLVAPEPIGVVRADHGVVGIDDGACRRIEELGPALERDHSGPIEFTAGAVLGIAAVARFADRHRPGIDEAGVAVAVGIDDVLRGRLVEVQRRQKLLPVPGLIDAEEGFGGGVLAAEAGPGEADHRVIGGE